MKYFYGGEENAGQSLYCASLGRNVMWGEEVLDWPVWIIPGTPGVWELSQDAP